MNVNLTSNYASKINDLKKILEDAKAEKIRAEQNIENLNKREEELNAEIRELGVDPEELEATIAKLESEIQADIAQIENMIPAQYKQGQVG